MQLQEGDDYEPLRILAFEDNLQKIPWAQPENIMLENSKNSGVFWTFCWLCLHDEVHIQCYLVVVLTPGKRWNCASGMHLHRSRADMWACIYFNHALVVSRLQEMLMVVACIIRCCIRMKMTLSSANLTSGLIIHEIRVPSRAAWGQAALNVMYWAAVWAVRRGQRTKRRKGTEGGHQTEL
ncbi:hypothetical protein BS78_05G118900 [Paspalum vaginatum]|nr:hypothetical protein BS78_05G118900 [Paspalum vaginatum]